MSRESLSAVIVICFFGVVALAVICATIVRIIESRGGRK